jgi:hypothetical protein
LKINGWEIFFLKIFYTIKERNPKPEIEISSEIKDIFLKLIENEGV